MYKSWLICAFLLLASVSAAAYAANPSYDTYDIAVLQGLDKITAKVKQFEAHINEKATFGTLEIYPRTCQKTPPEETPESAAFLEIEERRRDASPNFIFSGWMFASSPALSGMEHPIYDVWLLDCKKAVTNDASSGAE